MGDVQTRSELHGLQWFNTVHEAMQEAKVDTSIWKISVTARNGERIRLVRENGIWVYENIFGDRG